MAGWLCKAGVLLWSGCTAHQAPELTWDAEARAAQGEIRVLPVLEVQSAPSVNLDHHVVEQVPFHQQIRREVRTEMLHTVPSEVAYAVPGAVNGTLGGTWGGRFRPGVWPVGAELRVARALSEPDHSLDEALARVGRRSGGDAVWITWVRHLDGHPLNADGFAGDLVETSAGPVVLDLVDEPYLVEVDVGVALVTHDGEVLLRYEDRFTGVLSRASDPSAVGRDVARELADQLALMWPGQSWSPTPSEALVAWDR